jgi:hypothetical protein
MRSPIARRQRASEADRGLTQRRNLGYRRLRGRCLPVRSVQPVISACPVALQHPRIPRHRYDGGAMAEQVSHLSDRGAHARAGCTPQPSNGASARSSPIPCMERRQVSTRRVALSKRTTNAVLGPSIGIGKRRRRTTGSLARAIPFASATCRARRTAALRDESRPPTYLNSKLPIGPQTIASRARLLTAASVG